MAFKSCKSVSPTFHFIYDTLIHHRINHNTPTIVRFFETQSIANNSNFTENQALTISYLTKSCGLSFKSALSASMKLNIESTEKSNSVLELLRSHGFTKNHISFLISKRPQLILAHPENVRPKFEYIESQGYVGPDLPKIICSCNSVEKVMVPNINTLRAHGVPKSHIEKLIMRQPRALILSVDVFKEVTNAVKEMGFDPKSQSFLWAILPISRNTKRDWESKRELK
ncbi:uncharacterized protein LOC132316331 [Cornus florida]|uniref:uncharacterized protein LOC132316331 n=1 Tax=Cornus florida TaxID=4283 RepID=UPI00289E9A76|nr:uncharacterized protein LOC132316331 [Cornus florida]